MPFNALVLHTCSIQCIAPIHMSIQCIDYIHMPFNALVLHTCHSMHCPYLHMSFNAALAYYKYKHPCDSDSMHWLYFRTSSSLRAPPCSKVPYSHFIQLAGMYLSAACKSCRLPRADDSSFLPISAAKVTK